MHGKIALLSVNSNFRTIAYLGRTIQLGPGSFGTHCGHKGSCLRLGCCSRTISSFVGTISLGPGRTTTRRCLTRTFLRVKRRRLTQRRRSVTSSLHGKGRGWWIIVGFMRGCGGDIVVELCLYSTVLGFMRNVRWGRVSM